MRLRERPRCADFVTPPTARRGALLRCARLALAAVLLGSADVAHGIGSELLYQDPFDIGSGGASLTRASKEGIVFANPALLGLGGANVRWIGSSMSVMAGTQSIAEAQSLAKGAQGQSGASGAGAAATALSDMEKTPIHAGFGEAAGFVSSAGALSLFGRVEIDGRVHAIGSEGLPEVALKSEAYAGACAGVPIPTGVRWLSLGVAVKEVGANEQSIDTTLTDTATIQQYTSPSFVKSVAGVNRGVGYDAGSVIFLQGKAVDLTLAGTVDDIGGTTLSGPAAAPTEFKQVESVGAGLTFHTGADALHLSADYRDLADVYGELPFKRFYAGAKLLLRTHVGVGVGYYDGYPSAGVELDLWLVRFAFAKYTEELGDHPGADPRPIYLGSFSIGF